METLQQLLKDKLPHREFARFETEDFQNLWLKRFRDEDALKEATQRMLQEPPGTPLPPLLIKSLLQAFHPEALQQTGQQAQGLDELPPDAEMTRFVAALHDPQIRQALEELPTKGVLTLPKHVYWMGNSSVYSEDIYVRTCYPELLAARDAYREAGRQFNTTLFTGTPGIGKSHLAALVVGRFLVQGKQVLLEVVPPAKAREARRDSLFYRLQLMADGTAHAWQIHNKTLLSPILRAGKSNVVYVVDGGLPSVWPAEYTNGDTMVFASAREGVFVDDHKVLNTLVLYTPLFSRAECRDCRDKVAAFTTLTDFAVDDAFGVAGGIARVVLLWQARNRRITDWIQLVIGKLKAFAPTDMQQQLSQLASGTNFPPGSDMLFHWSVEDIRVPAGPGSPPQAALRKYTKKALRLASPFIAALVSVTLHAKQAAHAALFCMGTGSDLQQAACRGYVFEQLAHICLVCGGQFECRLLGEQTDAFVLKLPRASASIFHSGKHAIQLAKPDLSTYCMPLASNLAAIDSLSSPLCLFQMATGRQHGINREGLLELLRELPESTTPAYAAAQAQLLTAVSLPLPLTVPLLLFVTTPRSFDTYYQRTQNYVTGKKKSSSQRPLVQQAVLKLPLDQLLYGEQGRAHAVAAALQSIEELINEEPGVEEELINEEPGVDEELINEEPGVEDM